MTTPTGEKIGEIRKMFGQSPLRTTAAIVEGNTVVFRGRVPRERLALYDLKRDRGRWQLVAINELKNEKG